MDLVDIRAASEATRREAARILADALAHDPTAWANAEMAAVTVEKCRARENRRATFALENGALLGWIGAIEHSGYSWELHPLAVDPPVQRRGVGTALVGALEREAVAAGVTSIWLGCDDAFGGTSLFGRNLFPDPLGALKEIEPTGVHPYTFYQRSGYTICGAIPDATGPGRHDILMAKRIGALA